MRCLWVQSQNPDDESQPAVHVVFWGEGTQTAATIVEEPNAEVQVHQRDHILVLEFNKSLIKTRYLSQHVAGLTWHVKSGFILTQLPIKPEIASSCSSLKWKRFEMLGLFCGLIYPFELPNRIFPLIMHRATGESPNAHASFPQDTFDCAACVKHKACHNNDFSECRSC